MKKINLALIIILISAIALSGCSNGDNNNAPKQMEDGKLPVTVGYWGGTCEAPIFVAYENGYFEEAGLDVEMLKITSDVKLLLANDELDAFQLTPDMFKPIEQGLQVKIINSVHIGCIQGAASKESGIQSVADLEGKTVAAAVGSIPQIQISSEMVKLGLDPTKVNWVNYPNNQMEDALNKGEIDAFAAYDPFAEIAVQNGNVRFFSNTYDEGLSDYLCCFLGLSEETLAENPEIGKRLVDAFDKACQYLTEHPQEAAEMGVEKGYFGGTAELNTKLIGDYTWISSDKELMNKSVKEIWHQIERAGALTGVPGDKEAYINEISEVMVQYIEN